MTPNEEWQLNALKQTLLDIPFHAVKNPKEIDAAVHRVYCACKKVPAAKPLDEQITSLCRKAQSIAKERGFEAKQEETRKHVADLFIEIKHVVFELSHPEERREAA